MKKRLDILLVERKIATGRDNAKELIAKESIYVSGKLVTKPSALFNIEDEIELVGAPLPYVGRGGLKLEKAMEAFSISVKGLVCMDIGASTGGFTDLLLQDGAKKVYAVDVGTNQLVESLRNNPRVVAMEGRNIRHLQRLDIADEIDFITTDVSFISLKLVIPKISEFLSKNGKAVCLIKPQFEAGQKNVKKGIVRDTRVHKNIIGNIASFAEELGFSVIGIAKSPITGQKGNVEYLVCLKKCCGESINYSEHINIIHNI